MCLVRGGVPEPAPQRVVAGLPDPAARARHPHDRRGRRLDRPARRRRRARRRAAERGRGARPGRATAAAATAADRHRRRPRARPHPGRRRVPRSRPARRRRGAAPRSSAPASTADGRRRGRRRGDGAGGARRDGRARRRPARARARRVRRRGTAARVRDRRRARHARGDRPAARGRVLGGRAAVRAAPARSRADRRRGDSPPRSTRLAPTSPREARALVRRRRDGRDRGRLPLRRAEPRAHGARRRTTSRPSTSAATATRGPGAPVEVVAVRARASVAAPLRVADLPDGRRGRGASGPRSSPSPTARCGSPTGWRAEPARARRAGCVERRAMTIDPATLQVLISRLTGVADEMGAVLRRAAYSPNIKERADCSAALFTPDGSCSCRPSTSRCTSVRCRRRCAPRSTRAAHGCGPATRSSLNDPFAGGTHLNDVTFVAPVFADDGTLVGWVANRAHHADLGGMAPGSMPPDATEIYQEGLRIPPVRVDARGRGALRRRVAHARRAARRPRRAASARTGSVSPGCASCAAAPSRSPRSSTTASAGCAPRSPRCPTARTSSRTSSTRPAGPSGRRPARIAVARHGRRRRDHVRLHRHRRAARRAP